MNSPTHADAASATLARVLVVGAGGLSCPVASTLVASGAAAITLVDDDRVDLSNLHRQTLFGDSDIGAFKAEVAARVLRARGANADAIVDRFTPENAAQLLAGHTLVIDGADNFASKFLIADAAKLAGVPVVHAGVVRLSGWALSSVPEAGACLRCVFEDIPTGMPESCSIAGVLGPVVGVLGALQALLAVDLAHRRERAFSLLWSYDARSGQLRKRRARRRVDCPLCTGQIRDLDLDRYLGHCAA